MAQKILQDWIEGLSNIPQFTQAVAMSIAEVAEYNCLKIVEMNDRVLGAIDNSNGDPGTFNSLAWPLLLSSVQGNESS